MSVCLHVFECACMCCVYVCLLVSVCVLSSCYETINVKHAALTDSDGLTPKPLRNYEERPGKCPPMIEIARLSREARRMLVHNNFEVGDHFIISLEGPNCHDRPACCKNGC